MRSPLAGLDRVLLLPWRPPRAPCFVPTNCLLTPLRSCNSSDADADVLADYVLALLRHDGSVDDVRKLCESEIPDFLKEGACCPLRRLLVSACLSPGAPRAEPG